MDKAIHYSLRFFVGGKLSRKELMDLVAAIKADEAWFFSKEGIGTPITKASLTREMGKRGPLKLINPFLPGGSFEHMIHFCETRGLPFCQFTGIDRNSERVMFWEPKMKKAKTIEFKTARQVYLQKGVPELPKLTIT